MRKNLLMALLCSLMIIVLATGCGTKKEDAKEQTPKNNKTEENNNGANKEEIKENLEEDTKIYPITLNPVPDEQSGLLGVIYYNPEMESGCTEKQYNTNLQKHINAGNQTVTGLKTGCMKWYAYDETDTTYTMILDHNTTAKVQYNSTGYNNEPKEVAQALMEDTKSWKNQARLITGQEVANITDNKSWTADGLWYYFENNDTTPTIREKGKSKYAWLFDNTLKCTSYGCFEKDDETLGYWTSTPKSKTKVGVWHITSSGGLDNGSVDVYGLRPVITISK